MSQEKILYCTSVQQAEHYSKLKAAGRDWGSPQHIFTEYVSAQMADVYTYKSVNSSHQSIRSILSDERGMETVFVLALCPQRFP